MVWGIRKDPPFFTIAVPRSNGKGPSGVLSYRTISHKLGCTRTLSPGSTSRHTRTRVTFHSGSHNVAHLLERFARP